MEGGMLCRAKFPVFLLFQLLLITACTTTAVEGKRASNSSREALEISVGVGVGVGIGGAGGGQAPSPSEEPPPSCGCPECECPRPLQPSDFQDIKLYVAYNVIQRFKRSITCDPNGVTASWTGADICRRYQGFNCSNPPDNQTAVTISAVDFNGFGLCAPTLSGFIDQLPDIAIFHANSNKFSGTIPDLTKLRYLYELDVSNNIMSGPYPTNTLPLPQLIFLDLRFNSFSGAVPGSTFDLDLDVLFLNNNNFNQPLPAALGRTTVAYLTLANNGFTGPIPTSIGNTSGSLIEVLFLNNRLSGCLPYQIGQLSKATVFDAGNNQLTGPIPYSFGCLSSVEQLNLAGNLLYGQVPEVVCQLGNLANLSLAGNFFTSLAPSCWKLYKSGVLDVRNNCIPGLPLQRPPAQCAFFAAQPKFCAFMPSLYYIPCKSCNKTSTDHSSRPWAKDKPAPSPTYSALHRQNP